MILLGKLAANRCLGSWVGTSKILQEPTKSYIGFLPGKRETGILGSICNEPGPVKRRCPVKVGYKFGGKKCCVSLWLGP